MQTDINTETQPLPDNRNSGKVIAGFILLLVGGGLLVQELLGNFLPWWLFTWPMILIIVGLYSAARHNFSKPSAYFMIVIGTIFLLNEIIPQANFSNLFWPVLIICIGITMIVRRNEKWVHKKGERRKHRWKESYKHDPQWNWDKKVTPNGDPAPDPASTDFAGSYTDYSKVNYSKIKSDFTEDYLDATSIFGSSNKTILSKTFKGGEIINIFGGAEIDFTQADIQGRVVIDVTQIFGGIKLLVPPHWHVTSDTVALFAGIDDKRKQKVDVSNDKVLLLTGTSIFAGIEIRSY